eukprot:CAMPEP_0170278216 /NCGR_PEP_ID=MMETSP0116_2-20130129/39110_1 /TAXON_ID=400756 /ORGANISM="Durinskia baltica, Strain CSIRO CS-38" /LENGTH=85 /DNA_ID=CAMNT_0010529523 /DNA_START=66 /DNA_END=321 /DNA_ORIENTATION=+
MSPADDHQPRPVAGAAGSRAGAQATESMRGPGQHNRAAGGADAASVSCALAAAAPGATQPAALEARGEAPAAAAAPVARMGRRCC